MKSVLLSAAIALQAASAWCDGEADPEPVITATIERLETMAASIEEPAFEDEATLLKTLLVNVQAGPESCAPADTYLY